MAIIQKYTLILWLILILSSCNGSINVSLPEGAFSDNKPLTVSPALQVMVEDTESMILLSYTDEDNDLATSCELTEVNNVTVTTPCTCSAGACSVGITGDTDYNGAASFKYSVTANSLKSNTSMAMLTINAVDDAPVTSNITPISFNEETQAMITLSYTDIEGDQASSCVILGLTNVSISTPCSCSLGVCTVGVTGTANYSGAASFNYTVTANSAVSNSATASFTINNVNDRPVIGADQSETTDDNTTLSFTLNTASDVDLGDNIDYVLVSGPSDGTLSNCMGLNGSLTTDQTCDYISTVNFNGPVSLVYKVNDGTIDSVSNATVTINVNDNTAPVALVVSI